MVSSAFFGAVLPETWHKIPDPGFRIVQLEPCLIKQENSSKTIAVEKLPPRDESPEGMTPSWVADERPLIRRFAVGYRFLADLLLVVHLAFILFVVAGGLWALHRRGVIFLHLPALAWGIFIELSGRICPLTPWENHLRLLAGEQGYAGSFIEYYLLPLIYPEALTREVQWVLAIVLAAFNLVVYALFFSRGKAGKR